MSSQPCLFVSHSSKDNALTRQLCEALRGDDAAAAPCQVVVDFETLPDYDVLVDIDELQAGKPWPRQLHAWMARCHAAVLLLTANAVKSPWVLKEATILAWRLSLDESFRFITVRFADVTDEQLRQGGFDPLMLGTIQTLPGGDVERIATDVRQALRDATLPEAPFDSLCAALEDLTAKVSPNTLRKLGEKMRVPGVAWRPEVDLQQQYVSAIAARLLSENLGGYGGLQDLVDDLMATTDAETVEKILFIMAPHWVDVRTAGQLSLLAAREPRPAVAINGLSVGEFTAEMVVRKAYPLSRLQRVLSIPGGNAGDLVDHITRQLLAHANRDALNPGASGPLDAEQLADVMRHYARGRLRQFVVVPAPHPSPGQLAELSQRFPKLVFLLWTGEELPDDSPEGVTCLHPPVAVDEEERQREAYEDALHVIRDSR